MHSLMLRTQFIAQHFLIGKDFGQENSRHSHHYGFEIEIERPDLDEFNYIIDIIELKQRLDDLIAYFNDKTLNDLPEFVDQNPSLELFSKILWHKCHRNFKFADDCCITVRLWEDDIAQASYRALQKCGSD